jgi:transposase
MQKPKHTITKQTLKTLRGESPRERLLHRLHCVAMALNGSSASEAARIYGDSPRAVAYWVTQFKQHGIEGLEEEARPGRPSQLSKAQLNRLQTFVKQAGAKSKPVNAHSISDFLLKEFGLSLAYRQCWRILKRMTT